MKPEQRQVTVIDSGGESRKTRMSFDEESLVHLMGIMTEQYADPEMAIAREYISNAYDSHIAAGQTKPIQVWLPTALKPDFIVKDYGTGMSLEEVEDIYGKYGRSTKRESNDFIGMLGIGCKSGLAYADQFTIRAVKDGKATLALITRDEDGGSSIDVRSHEATEDPDGFEFSIHIRNISRIEQRVKNFLWFWKPGIVEVDGKAHVSIYDSDDVIWLEDSVLVPNNVASGNLCFQNKNTIIVQGGVPYPVHLSHEFNQHRVVHFADIGSVDPAPPRESLKENERTKKYIEGYKAYINDRVKKYVEDEMERANDVFEAYKIGGVYGLGQTHFKGVNFPHMKAGQDYSGHYQIRHYGRQQAQRRRSSNYAVPRSKQYAVDVIFVYNYKSKTNFSIADYRKMEQFLLASVKDGGFAMTDSYDKTKKFRNVITIDGPLPAALKPFYACDWEAANAWAVKNGVKARPKRSRAVGSDKYHVWNKDKKVWEVIEPDAKGEYVIFSDAAGRHSHDPTWVITNFMDKTPVKAPANRHEKFVREFPNAEVYKKPSEQEVKARIMGTIGKPESTYIEYNRRFSRVKSTDVVDPEAKQFLEYTEGIGVDMDAVRFYNELKRHRLITFTNSRPEVKDVLSEKYGEIMNAYNVTEKFKVRVMNALYQAEQKGKK